MFLQADAWKNKSRSRVQSALALLGYFVATTAVFSPVLGKLATHELTTGENDGLDFRWKVWWVRHAIVERMQSPFHTDLLWHPEGTSLWLDALTPINGLQAILLEPLVGPTATFNILVLSGFVLGGWFFYLFARTYVERAWAAFVGGLLFAFAPYHFSHLHGHLNFATIQFVPLFLWALCRGAATGHARWAVFAALAMLAASLSDPLYLVFSALIGIGIIAGTIWRKRHDLASSRAYRKWLVRFAAWTLVVVAPIPVAMLATMWTTPQEPGHDARQFSADLLLYFGPGATSYWNALSHSNWSRFVGNAAENAGGFGVVCMIACIVAVVKRSRTGIAWIIGAAVFALLSFGPELHIRGQPSGIPMPYAAMERVVPGIQIAGTPVRFCFLAMLCANVAACIGLDLAAGRLECTKLGNRTIPTRPFWFVLAMVVVVEFLPAELPHSRIDLDRADIAALEALHTETGDWGILTAPTHDNLWHKCFQIIHRRPMVGGFTSRTAAHRWPAIRYNPLAAALYGWTDPVPGEDYSKRLDELRSFAPLRYIVAIDDKRRALVRSLGLTVKYEGKRIAVFRLPESMN